MLSPAGNFYGGHYVAYIRPELTDWFKFNDDTVTKVSADQAIKNNFGTNVRFSCCCTVQGV